MLRKLVNMLKNPAWLCFSWFGISLGIAGIATPIRFRTPSVSREVAADVGQAVFLALNKVELALLVILLVLIRVAGRSRDYLVPGAALALIVIIQSAWLLPELAARANMIAAGDTPPATAAHSLYSALELGKYAMLFWIGFTALDPASPTLKAR